MQVIASVQPPFHTSALADCVTFMTSVITPCPVTITITAPTISSTVTTAVTNTQSTTFQTATDTTVTQTISSTTTITVVPAQKRNMVARQNASLGPARNPFDSNKNVEKRLVLVNVCSAVTSKPSLVPIYASACRGTVRYSSACVCDGVTAGVTTLSAVTSTLYTTPTTTVTATNSFSVTNVISQTRTIVSTTTQTAVATATVNVQKFYLTAQFAEGSTSDNIGHLTALGSQASFIDFGSDLTQAAHFHLDPVSQGLILTGSSGQAAYFSRNVGASTFVLVTTASYATSQGGELLTCTVSQSQQLTCGPSGFQTWWLCGGHLNLVRDGYDFTNACNAGTASKLNGIAVVTVS
jgi:hypothetical protein